MEETLQSLYADIAAIKEFVCNPTPPPDEEPNQLIRSLFTNEPLQLFLAANEKLILIYSQRPAYISTEFDSLGLQFSRYPFEGFGRINQAFFVNGEYYFKQWKNLDSKSTYYQIDKQADYFHITPYPQTEHFIEVWGKPA